jgi:GAF domain-containing protein
MNDDVKRSLDDLFSDFSVPDPESDVLPPEDEPEPLDEKGAFAVPDVVDSLDTSPDSVWQTWRQQLIRWLLRGLLIAGGMAVVVGSYNAYTAGDIWLAPLYAVAYIILAVITFWRRISYNVQVGALLSLIYGLGVLDLFTSGRSGDGRIFLVAFPVTVALFLNWRSGILALVFATLTVAAFGGAFSTGLLFVSPPGQDNAIAWLSVTIVFFLVSGTLVLLQSYVVPRLARALSQSRQLAQELTVHRDRLESQAEALRRQNVQLEASIEVGRTIVSIFDLDQLLDKTVNLIRERFDLYLASIFLLDESGEWAMLRAATGKARARLVYDLFRLPVDETSMVGWAALHRRHRVALDVEQDEVYRSHSLLPDTVSEMVFPLMVGEQLLGVLDIQSDVPDALDNADVRVFQGLAAQVSIAIQNARRVSDRTALLEATSPVYRASRLLTTATTPTEVADAIIQSVSETDADACLVVEFEHSPDREPKFLHYLGVWRGDQDPEFEAGMRLPFSESPFPAEWVSTFQVVTDVSEDEQLPDRARKAFETTDVGALVNIPLRIRDGVIGQVVVLRSVSGPFTESALQLYGSLSDQASVALERARLLEEAQVRARREATVRRITDKVSDSFDMETILRTAVEDLSTALGAGSARVELGLPENAEDVPFAQVDTSLSPASDHD